MTPTQQEEWADRLRLARDFAHGAVVWAVRQGMPEAEARREVAAALMGRTA